MGNGGYIAKFGDDDNVNLSLECCALSKKFSNLWVFLIFDAWSTPLPAGPRANLTGAAAVGV